jgi:V8-like Glu-specific endopeptidase
MRSIPLSGSGMWLAILGSMNLKATQVVLLAGLTGVLASCGGELDESAPLGHQAAGIINGSPSDHPAVGILLHDGATSDSDSLCTGTLVTDRLVLTAAHCVVSTSEPYTELDPLYFVVGTGASFDPASGIPTGSLFEVEEVSFPSAYGGATVHDVALVRLDGTVPADTARPMPLSDMKPLVGRELRVVGFGLGAEGDASTLGIQREAPSTTYSVGATSFSYGVSADKPQAPCYGDSGGPSLVEEDNTLAVIGVHTALPKEEACGFTGIDMRVDAYRPWIEAEIAVLSGGEPPPDDGLDDDPYIPQVGGYGAPCKAPGDCSSQICVRFSAFFDSYQACTRTCRIDANDCPDGDRCDEGYCVPRDPGSQGRMDSVGGGQGDVDVQVVGAGGAGCSLVHGSPPPGVVFLLVLVGLAAHCCRRRHLPPRR